MTLHISAETGVVRDAAAMGFTLMQRELDTGHLAWVWLPDDRGSQPSFSTRRQAIAYMDEKLQCLFA